MRDRAERTLIARRPARGFTLIELMVAVAILGVLLMVAVPGFSDANLSNKLSSIANSFSASAQIARSEAIKRNSTAAGPVRMCRSTDGTNCASSGGWEQGWIIFTDANNDSILSTGETLIFKQLAAPNGYYLTGTAYAMTFLGTGVNGSGATQTFKVCRHLPSVGEQDRQLVVGATGRVSVTTQRTLTCVAAS